MEITSIENTLLRTQTALLEKVTPELIAVVVDISRENGCMYLRIYYDGESFQEMMDLWLLILFEASLDLPSDWALDEKICKLQEGKRLVLHI